MRKHLLRILTVLLVVCFGAALFAACGDNNDKDPDQGSETTYTLTYNANGGTGADIKETHKAGDEVILKGGETFTRDDHTLTKWNDGTKDYDLGAKFEMPKANVTMKAVWETTTPPSVDKYTVTMAANANAEFKIVEPANETSFAKGTTVKFTVTAKTGYKIKSVKNGSTVLTAGQDGKYSVTVGEANIVITVETESTATPPATTYTVTMATNENVTFTIVEPTTAGPYAKGTTVKFTVTAKTGFKVKSVKNGSTVLTAGQDGKYSVTVGEANIVITVETEAEVTPEEKQITEFANANMVGGNLYLRMKVKGYDTADELKEDLKLLIGDKEIACEGVDIPGVGSDIYTVYFTVAKSDLSAIENGSSAEVKLSSTATGVHACPATVVDANQNSLTFDVNDVYTLKIEGEKLVLAYEHKETVDKEVSGFAGTAFVKEGENKIYITINITTHGYTEEEVKSAKLKIGSLEFAAASDKSNIGVLHYYIVGETVTAASLEAGDHLVTLELDGTSYKCPTIENGQIQSPIELGGKTYTLKVEGNGDEKALHLVIADAAPVVDSIEGVWTGHFVDEDGTNDQFDEADVSIIIKENGENVDVILAMLMTVNPDEEDLADAEPTTMSAGMAFRLGKETEGTSYGGTNFKVSLTDGKLVVTGQMISNAFGETSITLNDKAAITGTIVKPESGTYSNSKEEISVTFGAEPQVHVDGQDISVEIVQIGSYLLCFGTEDRIDDEENMIICRLLITAGDAENTFNAVTGETTVVLTEGELPAKKTVVTFDVDGETDKVTAQKYAKGETFKAPDAPTKENYKFLYWYYKDGDDEVEVDDTFVPADHATDNALTLYAKWQFDVKIGTPDNQKGYPDKVADYTETINQGEVVTFSGTMTSQGVANWNAPLLFFYSGDTAWGNLRADNYINPAEINADKATVTAEEFIVSKDVPPPHWESWTDMLKSAKVSITFNWERADVIYISILFRGDNGVNNGMVYSVTAVEGKSLKASYTLGISCEESYLVLNDRKATLVDAHTEHVYEDGLCTVCGAVQPADQIKEGTALTTTWEAGNFDTRKWVNDNFAKGSKVAIYGTQTKAAVTEQWLSLLAEVDFGDNTRSVTLRTDDHGWYFNNSETAAHLVEGVRKLTYLRCAKNLGEMHAEWEIVKNILAACDYRVAFDWTGEDIIVTMTFTATSGTAVGYTFVQQYTIEAGDAQTVGVRFGAEQASGTASRVVTA